MVNNSCADSFEIDKAKEFCAATFDTQEVYSTVMEQCPYFFDEASDYFYRCDAFNGELDGAFLSPYSTLIGRQCHSGFGDSGYSSRRECRTHMAANYYDTQDSI